MNTPKKKADPMGSAFFFNPAQPKIKAALKGPLFR